MRKLIGEYLKTERLIKKMDHAQVCAASGVSQSTMTRIENSHGNITLENLIAVLQTYGAEDQLKEFLKREIRVNTRLLNLRDKPQ